MSKGRRCSACADRKGSALVAVAILMVGVAMLSLAMLSVSSSAANTQRQSKDESASLYIAEAGVAAALFSLEQGASGDLGAADDPVDFGGTSYWVDTTDNLDGTLTVLSTGLGGRGGARIEVVVEPKVTSFFRWGAFGNDWLHLDYQAMVDSYDSSDGSYDDQTSGSGDDVHALEEGATASNGDVTLDQEAQIYGDSMPGVDGTITILGDADVTGSTMPLEVPAEMPEIDLPIIASTGPLVIDPDDTATIGPGDLHYDELSAGTSSTLIVHGPATVIFDSFAMYAGSNITVNSENGPVEFYVVGDFTVGDDTTVASMTNAPADITINLLTDNIADTELEVDLDELDFASNAKLYGSVYAPNAAIDIETNFELFGSLIARQLDLASNCRIHYDEALMEMGEESGGYVVLCWRELPYRPGNDTSESGL